MARRDLFTTSELFGRRFPRRRSDDSAPVQPAPSPSPQIIMLPAPEAPVPLLPPPPTLPALPPLAKPGRFVQTDAPDLLVGRFLMVLRTGALFSYPYAHVALIECSSPERVEIHCTCQTVTRIVIAGRNLWEVAESLTSQRLLSIAESDHNLFAGGGVAVLSISIERETQEAPALPEPCEAVDERLPKWERFTEAE